MNTLERFEHKRFGKLIVTSFSHRNKNGQTYWNCQCDCGKITLVRGSNLLDNKSRSCGCSKRGINNIKWKGCGEISGWFYNNCRIRAKKHDIKFDITVKDIWELFLKQNRRCALTNEILYFNQLNKCREEITASLDRIDSSKGYTIDNVQWVHKKINKMKMDLDEQDFINMCHKVTAYRSAAIIR